MLGRISAVCLVGVLVGCTRSGAPTKITTSTRTSTITHSASADPDPIVAGPTTTATADSCPYVTQSRVRNTLGMRLGRLTVLRSGGRVVGCRFYAVQNSPYHASERLPGPHQPVLEIVTQGYHSELAARNAFIRRANRGGNPQQVSFAGVTGVCFQTDFYPKDQGQDWACAANVGRTEVVVQSVDTTGTFSTSAITAVALRHV